MESLPRLRWLAGIVFPAMIVLLIARLGDLPADADGPSPAGRLAGLVTCVLSANPGQAQYVTPSAGTAETDQLDCDPTWADPFRTAWISAC